MVMAMAVASCSTEPGASGTGATGSGLEPARAPGGPTDAVTPPASGSTEPPPVPGSAPVGPNAGTPAPGGTSAGRSQGDRGAAPRIVAFAVTPSRDIPCVSRSEARATMSWRVEPDDVAIVFLVDGTSAGAAQAGFSGSMSGQALPVNFVCDGNAHTITLVAAGATGTAQASVAVSTVAAPPAP